MDLRTDEQSRVSGLNKSKPWLESFGDSIAIGAAGETSPAACVTTEQLFTLHIPEHWRPNPAVNVHAEAIEPHVYDWFHEIGFDAEAIARLRSFAPGRYAGIPFSSVGRAELLFIAKYLSLWLLWDDEDVESKGRGFQLRMKGIFDPSAHASTNLCDEAWRRLFQELALVQSPLLIEKMIDGMHVWSAAALVEAQVAKERVGRRVAFSDALQSRIATIGMYVTAHLLEYARHVELPDEFHDHAAIVAIKTLSNKIVGLGNDLISLGKDLASGYVNVILAYSDENRLSLPAAIGGVARMHDEALLEFDRLVSSLPSFGPAYDEAVALWCRDLRHACLGFTLWEARAPRYTAFKLFVNGAAVEPRFVFHAQRS